jgi:hypothetical protein
MNKLIVSTEIVLMMWFMALLISLWSSRSGWIRAWYFDTEPVSNFSGTGSQGLSRVAATPSSSSGMEYRSVAAIFSAVLIVAFL